MNVFKNIQGKDYLIEIVSYRLGKSNYAFYVPWIRWGCPIRLVTGQDI